MRQGFALLAVILSGCALGSHSGGFDGTGGVTEAGVPEGGAASANDAGNPTGPAMDGGALQDVMTAPDAASPDMGVADTGAADMGADAGSQDAGPDASGMDPLLSLPDPSGMACNPPGSENVCPSIEVCRIATPAGGRCEGCTTCNNLGAACTQSSDCDILFQCYAGKCANICPLGTSYCGAVTDCLDVGNATYGVCRPM